MDVVRRHIEKLRGRIEIRSVPGRGATFLLKLPLTLAIIDGLVVSVGAERYIVPLFAVREMFRPTAETIWTVQQRAEMALVRGTLLPVVRLYRIFGVEAAQRRSLPGRAGRGRSGRPAILPSGGRTDRQAGGRHQVARRHVQERAAASPAAPFWATAASV